MLHVRSSFILALTPMVGFAACSDAGFCRLPSPPTEAHQASPWSAGLAVAQAKGEASEQLRHHSVEVTIGYELAPAAQVSVTVPWVRNSGRGGTAAGLGDVQVATLFDLLRTPWGDWSAQVGIRLPTGDDAALPGQGLGYQPGLGSTDLIFGTGWTVAGWDARLGYLASLGGNETPGFELARGDDLALSLAYRRQIGTVAARLGMVGLQRLADSTVVVPGGGRQVVADSAGSQLNAQAAVSWMAAPGLSFGLEGAKALLARQSQAEIDGLTRSWSLAATFTGRW